MQPVSLALATEGGGGLESRGVAGGRTSGDEMSIDVLSDGGIGVSLAPLPMPLRACRSDVGLSLRRRAEWAADDEADAARERRGERSGQLCAHGEREEKGRDEPATEGTTDAPFEPRLPADPLRSEGTVTSVSLEPALPAEPLRPTPARPFGPPPVEPAGVGGPRVVRNSDEADDDGLVDDVRPVDDVPPEPEPEPEVPPVESELDPPEPEPDPEPEPEPERPEPEPSADEPAEMASAAGWADDAVFWAGFEGARRRCVAAAVAALMADVDVDDGEGTTAAACLSASAAVVGGGVASFCAGGGCFLEACPPTAAFGWALANAGAEAFAFALPLALPSTAARLLRREKAWACVWSVDDADDDDDAVDPADGLRWSCAARVGRWSPSTAAAAADAADDDGCCCWWWSATAAADDAVVGRPFLRLVVLFARGDGAPAPSAAAAGPAKTAAAACPTAAVFSFLVAALTAVNDRSPASALPDDDDSALRNRPDEEDDEPEAEPPADDDDEAGERWGTARRRLGNALEGVAAGTGRAADVALDAVDGNADGGPAPPPGRGEVDDMGACVRASRGEGVGVGLGELWEAHDG